MIGTSSPTVACRPDHREMAQMGHVEGRKMTRLIGPRKLPTEYTPHTTHTPTSTPCLSSPESSMHIQPFTAQNRTVGMHLLVVLAR